MTLPCKKFRRLAFALGLLIAIAGFRTPATAQSGDYVEGITAFTADSTSQTLYSYSLTYETYDLCLYYSPYVDAALYDNNTEVASAATGNAYQTQDGGCAAELDGQSPVTLGDVYTQVADHYVYAVYYETIDGQSGYYNPDYYSGFYSGNPDPSGTDYPPDDGGDLLLVEDSIYVGSTGVQITAAAPSIGSISPQSGSIGVPGTITVNGQNLIDPWTQTATPAITGSGVSLTVGSNPTDTQLALNYSIAQGATTGQQSLTLATTFGTSNAVTFTVGYPPAVVTNVSPATWTAGQNTSVTIAGTGFGNQPTISVNGTGVSLMLNSASADGTTIQATATVAAAAPSESVTVTVQPGYAGNNFYCGNCNGGSPNGTDTATVQPVTPAPQIMFNGANISGTTQPVMAGQQIALSVPTPNGYSIQSQTWSFSNQSTITGGFTNTAENGRPSNSAGGQEATDPDLTQNSLTFYWVNPGDNGETITCTYTLNNGQSASATATFNVQGPTGNLLPTATMLTNGQGVQITSGPEISTTGVYYQQGQIHGYVGITFTTAAQAPTGVNPSFTWIQIINNVGSKVVNSVGQVTVPDNPSTGLDGTYPYFNGTPNGTYDSPGSNLPDMYGELYRTFDATMYLLWDPGLPAGCHTASTSSDGTYTQTPSNCTSIPIPLGSIRWRWNGCAINTLQSQTYGTWTRSCGYQQLYSAQSSGYPEWTATVNPLGN